VDEGRHLKTMDVLDGDRIEDLAQGGQMLGHDPTDDGPRWHGFEPPFSKKYTPVWQADETVLGGVGLVRDLVVSTVVPKPTHHRATP